MVLRGVFILRRHERGAGAYCVEFIRTNPTRQEFHLAFLCVKTPPAVGPDDGYGEWVVVFPKKDADAIRVVRVVLKLQGLFSAGDELAPVVPVLDGITGRHDLLPTSSEQEKKGGHIVCFRGGQERAGGFSCG